MEMGGIPQSHHMRTLARIDFSMGPGVACSRDMKDRRLKNGRRLNRRIDKAVTRDITDL